MDSFSSSLSRAEEIKAALEDSLAAPVSQISAREMTTLRGRMHQLRSLTAQLERGVMESGTAARRESVISLRRSVRKLERRLNNEDNTSSEEEGEPTGTGDSSDRSYQGRLDNQDKRLGSLHSSVVSLRGIGTEISTEIESHVRLLSDLEANHDFAFEKQKGITNKFKAFRDSASSDCSLYFMLAFLIIVLIVSVVGL